MRGSCLKTSIADRRVSLMLSGDMSQWRTSRPVTKAGGIKRLGPPSGTYALRGLVLGWPSGDGSLLSRLWTPT